MMKKLFFTLGLTASCLWMAIGQTTASLPASSNSNAPELTFESQTLDYGTVEKGSDGVRVFVFTNTGKEPLIITKTEGTCGCTVPVTPKEPIAPGETGEIEVKYDTKRLGGFTKTVKVYSNAAGGTQTITIKGVVVQKEAAQTTPVKELKTSLLEQR